MRSIFLTTMIMILLPDFCSADEGVQVLQDLIPQDLLMSPDRLKSQNLLLKFGQYQIRAHIVFYTQQQQDQKIIKLTQSFAALIKNRTSEQVGQFSHIYYSPDNGFSCRDRHGRGVTKFYAHGSVKTDQARQL